MRKARRHTIRESLLLLFRETDYSNPHLGYNCPLISSELAAGNVNNQLYSWATTCTRWTASIQKSSWALFLSFRLTVTPQQCFIFVFLFLFQVPGFSVPVPHQPTFQELMLNQLFDRICYLQWWLTHQNLRYFFWSKTQWNTFVNYKITNYVLNPPTCLFATLPGGFTAL